MAEYRVLKQYDLTHSLIGLMKLSYMSRNAFVKRWNEGEERCSKEDCNYIFEEVNLQDCIILYNSDYEYLVY